MKRSLKEPDIERLACTFSSQYSSCFALIALSLVTSGLRRETI